MQLNSETLRQHFESLSDDALFEIDRNDLVELAQRIYDEEVARRDFHATLEVEPEESDDNRPKVGARKLSSSIAMDEPPKWLSARTLCFTVDIFYIITSHCRAATR